MGLGNTGMDIQSNLRNVTRFFLKDKTAHLSVFIHDPNKNNLFFFCVVINVTIQGKRLDGSSTGKNLYTTFIKALSEVGESIICHNNNFSHRSGFAGGLLLRNAIHRAKAELIERDAFLYHYRNLIPFLSAERIDDKIIYELKSAEPKFKVVMVIKADYLVSDNNCLIFGMGSDDTIENAKARALREYSAMYLNHQLYDGCGDKFMESLGIKRKTDFHHSQSKSKENKHIFKLLNNVKPSNTPRAFDSGKWLIDEFESPINFFKFVKASHPNLLLMDFGAEEKFPQFNTPVFHPFW